MLGDRTWHAWAQWCRQKAELDVSQVGVCDDPHKQYVKEPVGRGSHACDLGKELYVMTVPNLFLGLVITLILVWPLPSS